MKYIFSIYQWVIAIPILVVLTIIVALVTILLSLAGLGRWGGYYPASFWAKCWCWLLFVRVEVKNRHLIDKKTMCLSPITKGRMTYFLFTGSWGIISGG